LFPAVGFVLVVVVGLPPQDINKVENIKMNKN